MKRKHNSTQLLLEKRASEFRQAHGLNDREPIRLKSLLQKLNVQTLFKPLSDQFCGMAIKSGQHRFMLVNTNQSLGRQHFTICHELYHLFIQADFTFQVCIPGQFDYKNPEEYKADWFAAYLLIPRDGVLSQINNLDELDQNQIKLSTILTIEQYFSCSRQALLRRLEDMELIDRAYGESLKQDVKRSATLFGFTTELYESGNEGQHIGDYGTKAKQLFDSEKISESHYYALLKDLGVDINALQV
ncbi:ImmA/IrrE family metallo-endopeptidase [Larkinella punicea]|uniref:ImmA/IrrE family metallo-endopeptidase n=1 Tax=Larkinella punicea TaxID=2315727 RepID=A0A368JH76_9BACT|nr:ImmA/IrrE family metallo-endopeptidase [Larkinella punicea]RCR66406.1 ImmA/IrrE family metallo-endopeptidase [Larkinella punicea]